MTPDIVQSIMVPSLMVCLLVWPAIPGVLAHPQVQIFFLPLQEETAPEPPPPGDERDIPTPELMARVLFLNGSRHRKPRRGPKGKHKERWGFFDFFI